MEFQKNEKGLYGSAGLVKAFFSLDNREMIDMQKNHKSDVIQLASAIARQFSIPTEELAFTPVEY